MLGIETFSINAAGTACVNYSDTSEALLAQVKEKAASLRPTLDGMEDIKEMLPAYDASSLQEALSIFSQKHQLDFSTLYKSDEHPIEALKITSFSGKSLFFIKGQDGKSYFLKAFPQNKFADFVKELSSTEFAASLGLRHAQTPSVLALGKASTADGLYCFFLQEAFEGMNLRQLMEELIKYPDKKRDVVLAFKQAGRFLGELKERSGHFSANYPQERIQGIFEEMIQKLHREAKQSDTKYGLKDDELAKIKDLLTGLEKELSQQSFTKQYAHGNGNPKKFMFNSAGQLLAVGFGNMHETIGSDGKPVGIIQSWMTLTKFEEIIDCTVHQGLNPEIAKELKEAILEGFKEFAPLPSEAILKFCRLRYFLGRLDHQNKQEPNSQSLYQSAIDSFKSFL